MQIKISIFIPLLLLMTFNCFCQLNQRLCASNEEIIFAFQLSNKKWVSVCKEKNDSYIVYRFGTIKKVELTYPNKLDSSSWQQFSFKGYSRGGGKQNDAMWYGFLDFTNGNVEYEVYNTWNSEDNKEQCGITVTRNGKNNMMSGILKTKKESLVSLLYNEKIKKEEE